MVMLASAVLDVFFWLLVLRVLADFVPAFRRSAVGQLIFRVTEPALAAIRGLLPPLSSGDTMIDLSPVIAVLVLHFIQNLLR